MYYIVFDLEFNQDLPSLCLPEDAVTECPYEIIQIGAVKTDAAFHTIATFNRYVRPVIYNQVSTFVTELTGIRTEQLLPEAPFPQVFHDYLNFIGEEPSIFCVWGTSDLKELHRNVNFHKLDQKHIPAMFINLQPHVSAYLNLPKKKLLSLKAAVEELHIVTPYEFHNAFYDAYYTAELWKKMNNSLIQPERYHPAYVSLCPRPAKKTIDIDKLLQQFEKMYQRSLTEEETSMILLAYKMGRTNQFIK